MVQNNININNKIDNWPSPIAAWYAVIILVIAYITIKY